MKKTIITMAIFCLSLGMLSACGNSESASEPEEVVASKLEDDLLSEVDGVDGLENQIDEVYSENYDTIYKKVNEEFNEDYYDKLYTSLRERLNNNTDKSNFDNSYDEAFKEVFDEFYDNFCSKNVIHLDDDEYTNIYNDVKDKYYAELYNSFVD